MVGTDNRYLRVTSRVVKTGRSFNDGELRAGAAVCLLGETVKKKLFGAQDAPPFVPGHGAVHKSLATIII